MLLHVHSSGLLEGEQAYHKTAKAGPLPGVTQHLGGFKVRDRAAQHGRGAERHCLWLYALLPCVYVRPSQLVRRNLIRPPFCSS